MTDDRAACVRCIMTTQDDPGLTFDESGLCNHCRQFDIAFAKIPKTESESQRLLAPVISQLKEAGKGKPYDCLIGLSGGVDSTYIALLMKRYGLRPLALHLDNGWDSELAVENIDRTISKLGFDLMTYVIDWEDLRELQLAYLRASVIDIEAITDHAIYGALYDTAIKNKITHIISGVNVATEYFLPGHWLYDKLDYINIQDIYRKHGSGRKLRNYPFVDAAKQRRIRASGITIVEILNMIPYDLDVARAEIEAELDWRPYYAKHHESVFTRFYQGYILPRKFGVDKRKAHLSNLICSGQMTREQALVEIERDFYSARQASEDLAFACKKLRLTEAEFEELMQRPARRHLDFDNYRWFFARYPMFKPLLPLWRWYRSVHSG